MLEILRIQCCNKSQCLDGSFGLKRRFDDFQVDENYPFVSGQLMHPSGTNSSIIIIASSLNCFIALTSYTYLEAAQKPRRPDFSIHRIGNISTTI